MIIEELNVQGQKITHGDNVIYLGFWLDWGLTYDKHVSNRMAKATGTLYFMFYRGSAVTPSNKILLRKQVIRSK